MKITIKNKLSIILALLLVSFVPTMMSVHAQSCYDTDGNLVDCGPGAAFQGGNVYTAPSAPATPAPTGVINPATPAPSGVSNPTPLAPTGVSNPATPAPTGVSNPPVAPTGFFYLQNPLCSSTSSFGCTVGGIVGGFLAIVAYLAVLAGVLMIIWIGLQFVLAQGKPERMNELKTQLGWVLVGIAVVIGARILVTVVINTLQATGTVNSNVIQNADNALNSQ